MYCRLNIGQSQPVSQSVVGRAPSSSSVIHAETYTFPIFIFMIFFWTVCRARSISNDRNIKVEMNLHLYYHLERNSPEFCVRLCQPCFVIRYEFSYIWVSTLCGIDLINAVTFIVFCFLFSQCIVSICRRAKSSNASLFPMQFSHRTFYFILFLAINYAALIFDIYDSSTMLDSSMHRYSFWNYIFMTAIRFFSRRWWWLVTPLTCGHLHCEHYTRFVHAQYSPYNDYMYILLLCASNFWSHKT